jgi:hypothetical protein
MTRISLRKGLHLTWQGREYVIEQCLTTGEVLLQDVLTNHLSTLKGRRNQKKSFQSHSSNSPTAVCEMITRLHISLGKGNLCKNTSSFLKRYWSEGLETVNRLVETDLKSALVQGKPISGGGTSHS